MKKFKYTYSFFRLIVFLRSQRDRKYSEINEILEIFESNTIKNINKRELIIKLYRDFGLVEEEIDENITVETELGIGQDHNLNFDNVQGLVDEALDPNGLLVPIAAYRVKLLDSEESIIVVIS